MYSNTIALLESEKLRLENELSSMNAHSNLKGIFVKKYVTCGTPNCVCVTQGRKHGPYYYIQYKDNGKIRYIYIELEKAKILEPKYIEKHEYDKKKARLNKVIKQLGHLRNLERRKKRLG